MTNTRTRKVPAVSSRAANRQPEQPPVDSEPTRGPRAVEPIDDGASLALGAVLDELGALDDATIMLYRLAGRGQELEYVATLTPEQVQGEASLLEMIRLEHGGGTYRVHVRDGAGLIANRRIVIAERKGPPAVDGGLSSIVATMLDRQAQQFAELIRSIAPQQRGEADAEAAMLARLKTMADIVRPAAGTDTKELLTLLMQGVQLGKSMQPPADVGTEGLLASALQTFGPVIADAAAQRRAQPARPRIGAGQPKAPQPAAQPAPTMRTSATPQADDSDAELRNLLRIVLRAAEGDADPELYADLVIDQVGEQELQPLVTAPEGVDLVAMLAQIEPGALQHRAWFERLIAAIKEQLSDEHSTLPADGDSLGSRGSRQNAADHAQAG